MLSLLTRIPAIYSYVIIQLVRTGTLRQRTTQGDIYPRVKVEMCALTEKRLGFLLSLTLGHISL